MASKIGVEIGRYWQISTNLHMYMSHIEMMKKRLDDVRKEPYLANHLMDARGWGNYKKNETQPLITDPLSFDSDLLETMMCIDRLHENLGYHTENISNTFLRHVVLPMAVAHQCYKNKDELGAYTNIEAVTAEDWRTAGKEWLDRRFHERRRSSQA
jgi:hypothetical protein